MSLSPENKALIERELGPLWARVLDGDDRLNLLLDAARQEGARGGEPVAWTWQVVEHEFGQDWSYTCYGPMRPDECPQVRDVRPLYASPAEPVTTGYAQVLDEPRPAKATGEWSDVWSRADGSVSPAEPSRWRADQPFSLIALAEVATKAVYTHGFGFRGVVGPDESNGRVYVNFAWDDDRLVHAIFFVSPGEEPLPPTSEGGGA